MTQITDTPTLHVDWADWLRRWDAQQSLYMTTREERFEIMLDALEATRDAGGPLPFDLMQGELQAGAAFETDPAVRTAAMRIAQIAFQITGEEQAYRSLEI